MKTKRTIVRFIILPLFILAMLNTMAYPQGTDSRRVAKSKDKLCIGIIVTPQQTNIINEGFSSALTSVKGNTLNISVDAAYFFSGFAGVSIGAGLDPYSSVISLPSYSLDYNAVDSELESYEMQIDGRSIDETQNISYLSIPVSLVLRVPAGNKSGFFVKGGVSAGIPMVKTYSGTGIFTYDGYYAEYPVTLHDVPAHGFPSDLSTNVSENLEIKPFTAALTASGGFYAYLGTSLQVSVGANFNKSLSGISAYPADTDFRLTSSANELNSIMGGSTKTGIQALGISIGIRYFIN